MKKYGIITLHYGNISDRKYYNNQEIGLAKEISKLGYKCFIFIPNIENTIVLEEKINDNVFVVNFPSKHLKKHSFFNPKFLSKYNLDYLQINADNQFSVEKVVNFCLINNINYHFYLGTLYSSSNNLFIKLLFNIVSKRNINLFKEANCFVKTNSIFNELKNVGVKNINLAHVGLDVSKINKIDIDRIEIRNKLSIPKNKTILLFVGRLEEYKKPLEMVEIIKKLNINIYCIMIGSGSQKELIEKEINNYTLKNKVKMIDKVKNNEIGNYYYAADYFINLNPNEIFGMSILEAMYQGCNVIAVEAPGPKDIIENMKNGFIVKNKDEIIEIINNKKKLDNKKIKETVEKKFSWENTAKIIIDNIK